jgi:uncharacterized membrane protein YqjE
MGIREGDAGGIAPPVRQRPLGEVVASVVGGFRTLVRRHAELAKIEIAEAASARAVGAGMFAGAAVVGMYALGFLAAAIAAGLAVILPVWAAILIVAVLLLVAAAVLAMAGRRALQSAPAAGERTRETLKEDARWAKQQIGR